MLLGLRDPISQRFYPIQRRAVIGSSSRCQIVLDDDLVSKEHARIRVGSIGLEIDDLGTEHGTFVNGYRVDKHFLSPRDEVSFGGVTLVVVLSADPAQKGELCRRCGVRIDPNQTRRFNAAALRAGGRSLCDKCGRRPSGRLPGQLQPGSGSKPGSRPGSGSRGPGSRSMVRPGSTGTGSKGESFNPIYEGEEEAEEEFSLVGYELLGLIGEGNQGLVYKMKHPVHGLVAVKRLAPEGGRKAKARFKREASALEQLEHPNLVRMVETREVDSNSLVIVMEFVDGPSLLQMIQRTGPLEPQRALRMAHQLSQGLAYAASKGIVNRDVKPSNVLVGPGDVAKLTDFGLVRFEKELGTRLTIEGQWLGTPHYMAPEQVEGKEVVPATDVYGLGASFYEAVTGKLPFPAKTPGQLFRKILLQPVDVQPIRERAGEAVAALFERMLAKKPGDRPSPDDLPDRIAEVLTGE